jgi:hypothetical protein
MSLTKTNFVPPTMLLDSVTKNQAGKRLTCFKLRYPKMVHGDFMTHRVFSRNASSSRAIPTMRLAAVDMYVPDFRVNKSGMQPGAYLTDEDQSLAEDIWRSAASQCLHAANTLANARGLNVHKQWTNRMLEWFGYINVIVSATDYLNFIGLRTELDEAMNPMAQDEIYFQAEGIRALLASHEPTRLNDGEWHLPLILDEERAMPTKDLLWISAARCAGISYETVDGQPMTIDRAKKVCNKLLTSRRVHASPFEHQGMADPFNRHPELHGNFTGWIQHRKMLPNECIKRE